MSCSLLRLHSRRVCETPDSSPHLPGSPGATELLTRWGRDLDPAEVLPEYPRPQLVRDSYLNLNGWWDHAFTPPPTRRPTSYDGPILVPFSPEAPLSGVGRQLRPTSGSATAAASTCPPGSCPPDGRLLLHFGAVDQTCTVRVDGVEVGSHAGGYLPFTCDVTDALRAAATASSRSTSATSPTGSSTPRGKQRLRPRQHLVHRPVGHLADGLARGGPAVYVDRLMLVPHLDDGCVEVTVHAARRRGPRG